MSRQRLVLFTFAYIMICIAGMGLQIIPYVNLTAFAPYLAALIMAPIVGALVGFIGFIMVGYWQGLPLGIAGHLMLAISVGTAAYYFGTVMEQKKNSGWLRYAYAIGWGYVGQVVMGLFLLWCLIGEQELTIFVPWSVAALLAMLLALAVDYAWPEHLRHVIGGPLPQIKAGRNRARKRRTEVAAKKYSQKNQ